MNGNAERSERAYRALLAYGDGDIEGALRDLLLGMRLLCEEAGYDWDTALFLALDGASTVELAQPLREDADQRLGGNDA